MRIALLAQVMVHGIPFLILNVRVLAEARFGADSQEPLVRLDLFHGC